MSLQRPQPYVCPAGHTWHPYALEFQSPEGTFGFELWAISPEHAQLQLDALRESARVLGRVVGRAEWPR